MAFLRWFCVTYETRWDMSSMTSQVLLGTQGLPGSHLDITCKVSNVRSGDICEVLQCQQETPPIRATHKNCLWAVGQESIGSLCCYCLLMLTANRRPPASSTWSLKSEPEIYSTKEFRQIQCSLGAATGRPKTDGYQCVQVAVMVAGGYKCLYGVLLAVLLRSSWVSSNFGV